MLTLLEIYCSIVMKTLLGGIRAWLETTAAWSGMWRALEHLWRVETYLPFISQTYLLLPITLFISNAKSMQVSMFKKLHHTLIRP